jgi:hypothetical protein
MLTDNIGCSENMEVSRSLFSLTSANFMQSVGLPVRGKALLLNLLRLFAVEPALAPTTIYS